MTSINSKVIEKIVMEIRPKLQSANVFLILKENVHDINVLLNVNDISISVNNQNFTLPCTDFEILPNSFTCLKVVDKHVSFRFSIKCAKSCIRGSFKYEIIQSNSIDYKNNYTCTNWLTKNIQYLICCSNCLQVLSNTSFDRVLPLPSDYCLDSSDWFCHQHNSNVSLEPKLLDAFYTHCHIHLNNRLLKGTLSNNNVIICKRCLFWIGLILNENTHKFWFNTILFKHSDIMYQSIALNDVFNCVNEFLSNAMNTCTKLLLSCPVSANLIDYIFIWIIEKKLNVRFYVDEDESQSLNVAKVLFTFESNKNDNVKQWINDVAVTNLTVSKPMIVELIKHLYKINKYFPRDCRMSNNMFISYLMLDDTT